MTLAEIMADSQLSDWGKQQEILIWEGHGGPYTVCSADDVDWPDNGRNFRDLRTARAYALLCNTERADALAVLGPDSRWHDAGYEAQ